MPELPDLLYVQKYLRQQVTGKSVTSFTIKKPVVLRVASEQTPQQMLVGKTIRDAAVHGPFLRFGLEPNVEVIMNLMLAGKLQHQRPGEKAEGHLCCSFTLSDGSSLNLCDQELMAKVYLVPSGQYGTIPKYERQGVDILSADFTKSLFRQLATAHRRKQVRVFINDHTILSAIGNAYADEILFGAGIHPKTFVAKLSPEGIDTLYHCTKNVMQWGIDQVEKAGQPIHVKVRDHMKVRNRKGEPCPRCGSTIRREGVRGHDVYFCPECQPATRKLFLDWRNVSES